MPRAGTRAKWSAEKRSADNKRKLENDAARRRLLKPELPPYKPAPPRGPQRLPKDAYTIPEGHELGGLSTLMDGAGEVSAQWQKTRVAGAERPPTEIPPSFLLARTSVMQRGDGSVGVQWSSYDQAKVDAWEGMKAAVIAHAEKYIRPVEPVEPPRHTSEDLLVTYPLGDPHIGMLAWAPEVGAHFDLAIAKRELCECMRQMVARSPASRECIITNLGDFWHAENEKQATPKSGHKLDVDGRGGKVGQVGLAILDTLIATALTKHEVVRFRSIPGNHDPQFSSFWLPETMRRTYLNEPRVIVEPGFNPYQYDVFGANVIGWCHGDGARIETLGAWMAACEPEKWGGAMFRYWQTGHEHHLRTKELLGCTVFTHRTLAGKDAWHHHAGYGSHRSLQAMAYHRDWGLDSIALVGVERVRAAILAQKVAA